MATQYLLDGTFTTITEESGTIQNVGYEAAELVSTTNVAEGEGIELLPGEKRTFNGTMKARSKGAASTTVNVVDFKEAAGGGDGGSYTLPVATSSKLGGVKSSNVPGKISVDSTGVMTYNVPETELSVGEVGYVSWQYSLLNNHLPLDGSTISDASQDYPELLQFFSDNNLMAATSADYDDNKALCYYDSSTDELTMPDFLYKTVWGGNTIEEKEAGLPNITGSFMIRGLTNTILVDYPLSAFSTASGTNSHINANSGTGNTNTRTVTFNASQSNSIYSDSVNTVQPPAIQLIPQIRYAKDVVINDGTPIGTVISFLGLTAPTGYLACDGTAYNIADYAGLASFIETQYGSVDYFGGDGTTTFAVPDLTNATSLTPASSSASSIYCIKF